MHDCDQMNYGFMCIKNKCALQKYLKKNIYFAFVILVNMT